MCVFLSAGSDEKTRAQGVAFQIHDRAQTGSVAQHSWRLDFDRYHDMAARQVFAVQREKQQTHVSLSLQVGRRNMKV